MYQSVTKELQELDQWDAALTAHEVIERSEKQQLKQTLASWYDDIRYGEVNLTTEEEQQVDQLWREWQQK